MLTDRTTRLGIQTDCGNPCPLGNSRLMRRPRVQLQLTAERRARLGAGATCIRSSSPSASPKKRRPRAASAGVSSTSRGWMSLQDVAGSGGVVKGSSDEHPPGQSRRRALRRRRASQAGGLRRDVRGEHAEDRHPREQPRSDQNRGHPGEDDAERGVADEHEVRGAYARCPGRRPLLGLGAAREDTRRHACVLHHARTVDVERYLRSAQGLPCEAWRGAAANPSSTHHSIPLPRVAQWEARWDILRIF